jgi:hypothetical protein
MTKEKNSSGANFNSLLLLVAIAVLTWNGSATVELVKKMARVETLIEGQQERFREAERRIGLVEAIVGIKPKTAP